MFELVPGELREINNWVRWKLGSRTGTDKPTKLPHHWSVNRLASVDDPRTWGRFEHARQWLGWGEMAGLGFVFSAGGGLVGIDLDGCRDSRSGEITGEWAREILGRFAATYAEVSPSGSGIKLFCRARLPTDRSGKKIAMPGDHCGIEVYQRSRFFCVTGQLLEGHPSAVADCQAAVDWLWESRFRGARGLQRQPATPIPDQFDRSRAVSRAWAFIDKIEPAVEGRNGSGVTFRTCCELYRFGLNDSECAALIQRYNARCQPPWSDEELAHKLEDARDEVNESGEFGARLVQNANGSAADPAKPAPTPIEQDDDPHRLARVNLRRYSEKNNGRTLRYWRDEWYVWRQTHYRRITEKELRSKVAQACKAEFDRLNVQAIEDYEHLKAEGKLEDDRGPPKAHKVGIGLVSNVIQATSGMCGLSSTINPGTWLPTRETKNFVSMKNGIIDMDAVIADADDYLRPHSPDWFSTIHLPYSFDANATCPKWESFLERNLEMDPERIKLLQEWAGYLLLPDTGHQKFLVLEGEGANGKSVFCAGIEAMVGAANVSHVPLESFGERFELTSTLDRLVNICGDAGELDKVSEGHIKSFTGGNSMTFGRKYLDPIERTPTARLMLAVNNRPRFSDRSDGVWRRMLLVPWRIQIPIEDRVANMDKSWWWERSGELPGMLIWAIEGLHRLRNQGRFTDSTICNEALAEYQAEMNPARTFIRDHLEESESTCVWSTKLYEHYAAWTRSNGNMPLGERQFGREISRQFRKSKRSRAGAENGRAYFYTGIKFSCEKICGKEISDAIYYRWAPS